MLQLTGLQRTGHNLVTEQQHIGRLRSPLSQRVESCTIARTQFIHSKQKRKIVPNDFTHRWNLTNKQTYVIKRKMHRYRGHTSGEGERGGERQGWGPRGTNYCLQNRQAARICSIAQGRELSCCNNFKWSITIKILNHYVIHLEII